MKTVSVALVLCLNVEYKVIMSREASINILFFVIPPPLQGGFPVLECDHFGHSIVKMF